MKNEGCKLWALWKQGNAVLPSSTASEEQLPNVAMSLEAMLKMVDDAMDETYCLELYHNSFGEENEEPQDLHEFAKSLGLDVLQAGESCT